MIRTFRSLLLCFSVLTLTACCNSGCDGGMSSFAAQFSRPVVTTPCNACSATTCSGTGGW